MIKKNVPTKLHRIKFTSPEQEADFEAAYISYFTYVYKYEVGHQDDFKPNGNPKYSLSEDRDSFKEALEHSGMCIKVNAGY